MEGIFPRSYVNVINEKGGLQSPPPTNYGNMPLDVSQSGSGDPNDPEKKNKFEQGGKKFGKKLGNAGRFPMNCYLFYRLFTANAGLSDLRCRCYGRLKHRQQHLLSRTSQTPHYSYPRKLSLLLNFPNRYPPTSFNGVCGLILFRNRRSVACCWCFSMIYR